MSGSIEYQPAPLTGAPLLARLASLSREDAHAVLQEIAAQSRTPGLQLLVATNLGQAQAAIGYRRPINPFGY